MGYAKGSIVKPERKCTKCLQVRPTEEYGFYASGGRKRLCVGCSQPPYQRGRGPWTVPNPCKNCGKTFAVEGVWCHVKTLKTCSPECLEQLRSVTERECSRCKRTLPVENFRKRLGSYETSRVCKICERDQDAGAPGMSLRPRPTAYQLHVTARMRAERFNKKFTLTRQQTRRLHRLDCELCGRAVSSLQLKNKDGDWTPDNIRRYCRRCNMLHKVASYEEILLLSHEIAARQPLVAEDRSHGKSRSKVQGSVIPGPPNLKSRATPRVYPLAGTGRRRADG